MSFGLAFGLGWLAIGAVIVVVRCRLWALQSRAEEELRRMIEERGMDQ